MRWVLALLLLACTACGVDPYLTCGPPCEDASQTLDANDAQADSAPTDAATDGCKGDGGSCGQATQCCSGACNNFNRCVSSCVALSGSCGQQQDCCIDTFCNGTGSGVCVQCMADGQTCVEDYECCSGSCNGPSDGGPKTCHQGN